MGNIFKCRVCNTVSGRAVPFARILRNMYHVPEHIVELKKLTVCFQVIETDESFAFIFNRMFEKVRGSCYKVFMFNGVPCIKLGSFFWGIYGKFVRTFYVLVNEDGSFVLSDNPDKIPGGVVIKVFGNIDTSLLPLDDLGLSSEVDEYYVSFDDGVFKFTPTAYPGEIALVFHGNGVYIPVDSFYDKLKKEVDGEKILLSMLFNDKDRRLEFMKEK
jgi:hypothetical protein